MLKGMSIICVGFLTDPHIPFHDRKGLAAAMNCLADSRLSALYLGGDVPDMYWCHGHGSKHPTPMALSSFAKEKDATSKFLDEIDKTWGPKVPKHWVEGNHEFRFERWLVDHAPELFGITDMRILFGMNTRPNWHYYDYGPNQLVRIEKTNLFAKHAPKGSSGNTIMNAAGCNLIFGHIHRIIHERKTTADKRMIQIATPGWLGDPRFDKVFGYVPGHHNWQQGFARIWINTANNNFSIEIVEVKNGRCIAGGKLYVG